MNMRKLRSNPFVAVCLVLAAASAFQVGIARAQRLNGTPVKFPTGLLGLQPGQSTSLPGWSKARNAFLAGKAAPYTDTPLGLSVKGAMEGGFLVDYYVTESGDQTVDYYFALSGMRGSLKAKHITVELDGFKGVDVQAGYRTDLGGAVAPIKASRTKSGDGITFTYDAPKIPVANDPPAQWAVICTNSKAKPQWTGKATISLDGQVQKSFAMIAP